MPGPGDAVSDAGSERCHARHGAKVTSVRLEIRSEKRRRGWRVTLAVIKCGEHENTIDFISMKEAGEKIVNKVLERWAIQ